ncbi:hypothetical protein ABTZ03_33360 [Kitasatospora sp. NPDC096077]
MRKMLIAAAGGLALAATLLFATAPGNAAPAPTTVPHTQIAGGTGGGCC